MEVRNNKFIGTNFDDFLLEEGLFAEVEAIAIKWVIAFQIGELMKEHSFSSLGKGFKLILFKIVSI